MYLFDIDVDPSFGVDVDGLVHVIVIVLLLNPAQLVVLVKSDVYLLRHP